MPDSWEKVRMWGNKANLRDYFDTWINGSPRAVDNSAIERRVRFGNPVVHRETTASLFPNFLAKSRWLIFFSLRIESMRAIISADSWTSVRISGDTDKTFSLNHSCLFLISQKQHHQSHSRFLLQDFMQIYRKFSIYANFLMQVLSDQQINDISSAWKADFAPDLSDERKKCAGGRFCSWCDTWGKCGRSWEHRAPACHPRLTDL